MPEIETPKVQDAFPSLWKWFSLLCSFNAVRHQKWCKINAELIFYQKTFISFNMCFEMCTCFNVIANVLMFMNSINKKKTHKLGSDLLKARLPQKYTQAETPVQSFWFSWYYFIPHTSNIKMQNKTLKQWWLSTSLPPFHVRESPPGHSSDKLNNLF